MKLPEGREFKLVVLDRDDNPVYEELEPQGDKPCNRIVTTAVVEACKLTRKTCYLVLWFSSRWSSQAQTQCQTSHFMLDTALVPRQPVVSWTGVSRQLVTTAQDRAALFLASQDDQYQSDQKHAIAARVSWQTTASSPRHMTH
eukprot:1806782-Amphidinium_carterae.1